MRLPPPLSVVSGVELYSNGGCRRLNFELYGKMPSRLSAARLVIVHDSNQNVIFTECLLVSKTGSFLVDAQLELEAILLEDITLRNENVISTGDDCLDQAIAGDVSALCKLLTENIGRLRRMVELRLDQRILARIDANDVLQEIQLCAFQEIRKYQPQQNVSFYYWLRGIAVNKLLELHRRHLDTQKRDVTRERSLDRRMLFDLSSSMFANSLVDTGTSPSQAFLREEMRMRLEQAIEKLLPQDKEIIALRHFEQLSPMEASCVLQISDKAASMRYLRALARLKTLLAAQA